MRRNLWPVFSRGNTLSRDLNGNWSESNDDVGVKKYRHLSAGALRILRASSPQVTMPGLGFAFGQVHPGQSLGQIEAYTNLLAGWHQTGEWYAVWAGYVRGAGRAILQCKFEFGWPFQQ
jgi:hypothetical protein